MEYDYSEGKLGFIFYVLFFFFGFFVYILFHFLFICLLFVQCGNAVINWKRCRMTPSSTTSSSSSWLGVAAASNLNMESYRTAAGAAVTINCICTHFSNRLPNFTCSCNTKFRFHFIRISFPCRQLNIYAHICLPVAVCIWA